MSCNTFDLLDVVESAAMACVKQAINNEHAVVGYMEPQLARLWVGDNESISKALVGISRAVMQVERGLDVCIRATNGNVYRDDSIGAVPIRFAVHYTYVGPEPAGIFRMRKFVAEKFGVELRFSIERGKGSYIDFVVELQPSDKQIERPLFIDRLNNIPLFVLSNEPPPNRAIHGNLRYWGLRCDGAPTFQEGILEITRQASLDDPYRLIIVSQPIEDGTAADVAREIRSSGLKGTKLIHIDRYYNEKDKADSLNAGFDSYFAKPFTTVKLLQVISEQLGLALDPGYTAVVPTVLIVDDNLTNQKMAMFQLRRLGITPDIAISGQEALEALARKEYSLILLDLQMPIMDGQEALKRIRADERFRTLPVVMVTALECNKSRQACMAAGASAFFQKPLAMDTMRQIVATWCSQVTRHPKAS